MNLEQFPTNETALEMMEMVTGNGFYDRSYIGKWLFQVMGMQMEDAKKLFEELREQIFPETATWGIIYHEQKFGLPSSDLLSLEERRKRVIQKRDIRNPMNPARLETIITNYTGRPCEVTDPVEGYIFGIFIDFLEETPTGILGGLYDMIDRLKPSHLSYNVTAEVETVEFYTKNISQLISVLFDMEFYTEHVCSFPELCINIYHSYQEKLSSQFKEMLIFPRNRQNGNYYSICFMGNKKNNYDIDDKKVEFYGGFHTKNKLICYLKQDSMFTFDGEVQFDGSRRFNAQIIEEVL